MKEEKEKNVKDKKNSKKVVAIVGGAVASAEAVVGLGAFLKKRKDKKEK